MSTVTQHEAWQPRPNAAAHAGAAGRQPTAPAFGCDQACVVALSEDMMGIGGMDETGRAFRSGDDT
jgi:hypothetical protein